MRSRWPTVAVLVAMLCLAAGIRARLGLFITPAEPFSGSVIVLDRAGEPLGIVGEADARERDVSLDRISPRLLRALIALEDRRFFAHDGVDCGALSAAAFDAIVHHATRRGGSTITMQLARMAFGIPRTPLGKGEELIAALRIEAATSKRDILTAYANRIPMGDDLRGVEAAARTYFATSARDLDWAQAATLAVLPNDPVALDPYLQPRALRERRDRALRYLAAQGVLDSASLRASLGESLAIAPRRIGIGSAPHLAFRLVAQAPGAPVLPTTIDADLQRYVTASARTIVAALGDRSVRDAAAIVVDNQTGDVLAYVGSTDYIDVGRLGSNDGVTALRQPGSALKPFLYEAAFEARTLRPWMSIGDEPVAYALPNAGLYAPTDYSATYAGALLPRYALANSLNVPAVKTLAAFGVEAFLDRLHALGFRHLDRPAAYYGLGLTLGSGEVSLEELARAYATMARDGALVRLRYRMDDPPSDAPTIGRPAEWRLVTDILADPAARARAFGVASILRMPFAAAVKTGTSSDFRDTWTIGFTRAYTVATWVGNFDGSPMRHVSGVSGAAPLWNRIMLHLAERREPARFPVPPGYARVALCARTGSRVSSTLPCADRTTEWLDARDRREQPRTLAAAPALVTFVTPHDGDVYRPGGHLHVTTSPATGVRIAVDARVLDGGAVFPLVPGTHTLQALRRGAVVATARLRVVAQPPRTPRATGFTLGAPASLSFGERSGDQ